MSRSAQGDPLGAMRGEEDEAASRPAGEERSYPDKHGFTGGGKKATEH